MLSNEEKAEAIQKTISTPGWRILKDEFMKKKQEYLELLGDTEIEDEAGRGNSRLYRAMKNAIDAFYEDVKDILEEMKGKKEE